tara:strand:- start:3965 stop:5608 length:1644 start_codon:yes stop_codon:yes gene_type:complete
MSKILLSDGNYVNTLGIIRDLSKAGHKVDCIGNSFCLASFSRYLNKVSYKQSDFTDDNIEKFISFLEKSNYDFFVPVGAKSIYLSSKYKNSIIKYTMLYVAEIEKIQLCLDKRKLLDHAGQIDFNIPLSWNFNSLKEFSEKVYKIQFPVITKSIGELSKKEVLYHNNKFDLTNYLKENIENIDDILIQERIVGIGYGFFAIYKNGEIVNYFMHRRIRESPRSGGSSTCAESVFDEELYKLGKTLLDSLNWHGVAMVEFKKCIKTGKFYLMEINPKFWGSHDLAISCGKNFANEILKLNSNNKFYNKESYKIGVKYQWPFEDFRACKYRDFEFLILLKDLLNPKILSNIWFSDLGPTSNQILFVMFYKFIYIFGLKKYLSRIRNIGFRNSFIRILTEFTGIPIPRYSFIDKHLSVGMQHSWVGKVILKLYGHNSILNLRSEFDDQIYSLELTNYKHIRITEYKSPSLMQLEEGADYIYRVINQGSKIYIHCREGISRAPLFACAYLVKYLNFTTDESIEYIKRKRPFINILEGQLLVLNEFYSYIANN